MEEETGEAECFNFAHVLFKPQTFTKAAMCLALGQPLLIWYLNESSDHSMRQVLVFYHLTNEDTEAQSEMTCSSQGTKMWGGVGGFDLDRDALNASDLPPAEQERNGRTLAMLGVW